MSNLKELVVISGRSGAGKSTASRALEDMGYFVVDNLPPQLLDQLLNVASPSKERVAVIIDVRETEFLKFLPKKWRELGRVSHDQCIKRLIYLDASDQHLINRYQETKRRHPLDQGIGIRSALEFERSLLAPIKEIATTEIITDKLNAHELRNLIKREVLNRCDLSISLTLISFGFKYGVPSELDLCFDVRFLTNPFYKLELREKTGLDQEVFDYVMSLLATEKFLGKAQDLIAFLRPLYLEEGKSNLTIAIGCTGGRHRSTSVVEALKKRLMNEFDQIRVEHRDIARHT